MPEALEKAACSRSQPLILTREAPVSLLKYGSKRASDSVFKNSLTYAR